MPTVLSVPATVTMSYSNVGYVPGPGAVVPSAISLKEPTGALMIWKVPCGPATTGVPIWMGRLLLLPWLIWNRRMVVPGMGLLLLSSTTPLMVVLAGSPGAF